MSVSVPAKPVVSPAFTALCLSENKIEFRAGPWSGPVLTISDSGGNGGAIALLEALDGETKTEEIIATEQRDSFDVKAILTKLAQKGIIVEATAREKLYLQPASKDTEKRAVLVVGDGLTAEYLTRDLVSLDSTKLTFLGVGTDPPAVPEQVTTESRDKLEQEVTNADHVVSVTDRPRPTLDEQLNEITNREGVRWTRTRIDGYDAVVGPTIIPNETACFECFRVRRDANIPNLKRYRHHREKQTDSEESTRLPAPFGSLVAGVLGTELHNQFANGIGFTEGRIVHYDMFDLSVEADEVLRLPRCPTCRNGGTSIDDPRHATLDSLLSEMNTHDTE